jgi:hypothetical protein
VDALDDASENCANANAKVDGSMDESLKDRRPELLRD